MVAGVLFLSVFACSAKAFFDFYVNGVIFADGKSLPLGEGGTAKPCRMRGLLFCLPSSATCGDSFSREKPSWRHMGWLAYRQCRAGVYSRRILCYNTRRKCRGRVSCPVKARKYYDQSTFRLPWQPFRQVTDAKLCQPIPQFARFLPHLYYWHTTFQNNHILPHNMTRNSTAADNQVGGCFRLLLTHFRFQEQLSIHIKTESAILINFIMAHSSFLHNPK